MNTNLIKNKYKIFTCFLLLIIVINIGCDKDFLEEKPQGITTETTFLKNSGDAVLATNAIYSSAREWNFYSGGYPILDVMSDDAVKGSNPGDGAFLNLFDRFQFTSEIGDVSRWYSALYKCVRRSNIVIERVPEIDMDGKLKNRLIAEAKFFRAFSYFQLIKAFGDVPEVTIENPPYNLIRTDKNKIYQDIIIKDLEFAIEFLPFKDKYGSADIGRITKGAAGTLLADVYLFRNDFVNSEKYALQVIESMKYDLEDNYSDAFSIKGQHGIESVFEIAALPEENPTLGGNQYANTQGVRGTPNRGWGFNRPSMDLINSFEEKDIRKDATIIFLNEVIDGITIVGDRTTPDITYTDETNTVIKEMETYNQKVWVSGSTTVEEWGYNVRIYRYAEVLLIAAEALNENGNQPLALDYLNKVRKRAGLDDSDIIDKEILRNQIWKERRLELALECKRYFDLIRQDRAYNILGDKGFIKGKNELLPIPQNEIDLSNGLLKQNPKW
ncbi:MAG: RagB/SusD family nutrient uptake outer membrane protein [Bacteroidetes bacterium]|nr:RagB/SusD family nutrient uptake outer membrane protein [Bacteroidota bacterium]